MVGKNLMKSHNFQFKTSQTKESKKANFIKRTITALVLGPLFISLVLFMPTAYTFLTFAISLIMAMEWIYIVNKNHRKLPVIKKLYWFLLGIFYCSLFFIALINISKSTHGIELTLWLFMSVWATDVGAYIAGTLIGGKKIAPSISANKTWAGLAGALFFSTFAGYIFNVYYHNFDNRFNYIFISPIIAIIAQTGDFLESSFKRYFKVKDSSNLLPGHGGFLDRFDGAITAAIFLQFL